MQATIDSKINMEKLNAAIQFFPQVTPVTRDMKMKMEGVSRLVMLDRYSFKDVRKITLTEGDLVVVTFRDDPKFPGRGYGFVTSIDSENRTAKVKLDSQFDGGKTIELAFDKIDKPLELYYEQIAHRVARGLAQLEAPAVREKIQAEFYHELVSKNFVPAGRVLYGAGSDAGVTFFNCYVMPFIHDSRGGIGDHRKKVMEIMSRGGGVGTNGSTLRPRDAYCFGVNGRSSGAVTWLNDLANLTNLVQQGGSRRGAQMIMMNNWHPDVVEFIISKVQNPKVLRFIIESTTSPLIKQVAEQKLNFTPLTPSERARLEFIVHEAPVPFGSLTTKILNESEEILKDGGTYSVHDSEFLSGANISVCITKDFMKAVEEGTTYDLRFPDVENHTDELRKIYDEEWQKIGDVREWEALGYPVRVYHTVEAKELWKLINICATYSAEPGIFFIDNANDATNAKAYGQNVVATNPCGEQPLAPWSVCNLAAINLAEMTKGGNVDWAKLRQTVKTGVRMQDNVIDNTPYFLEENTVQAIGERRVGLGVMGLHDLLLRCGQRYGTDEANAIVDEVFEIIAVAAYEQSIELAKEKGSFPFLNDEGSVEDSNREAFINSGFMKKMPEHVREGILEHGIRNSHLLTVAPTGSTGTLMNVSTGLEPYFSFVYYRSGRLGKYIPVVADIALEWLEKAGYTVTEENIHEMVEKLPKHFVSSMDLSPEEHADTQCVIQRWVDSSISKTVNAPKGFTVSQVASVYERLHKGGAKGGTVYVDGSRDAQVLTLTKEDNVQEDTTFESESKIVKEAGIPSLGSTSVADNNNDVSNMIDVSHLGIEIGDTCPVCEIGTVVDAGGCNTCNNCKAQLLCGL